MRENIVIYTVFGGAMINDKVKEILNEQINKEFYSAYLYLAMSAYFDKTGLYGFANWTKIQAKEEVEHGMMIFDHLIDRDAKVELKQINCPEIDFHSPLQVFEKILEHEKNVTAAITEIAYMSMEECDLTTKTFINWYITEQVEEESGLFCDSNVSLFCNESRLYWI